MSTLSPKLLYSFLKIIVFSICFYSIETITIIIFHYYYVTNISFLLIMLTLKGLQRIIIIFLLTFSGKGFHWRISVSSSPQRNQSNKTSVCQLISNNLITLSDLRLAKLVKYLLYLQFLWFIFHILSDFRWKQWTRCRWSL